MICLKKREKLKTENQPSGTRILLITDQEPFEFVLVNTSKLRFLNQYY